MSKQDNLTDFLTDVAKAIREKKGTSDLINPQNFSEEIRNLPSGGEVNAFGEVMVDKTGLGNRGVRRIILAQEVSVLTERYQAENTILEEINTDNIVSISGQCFYGCSNLQEINLSSAEVIGIEALQNCTSLKIVIFGKSLTTIFAYAFKNCSHLGNITFYSSPTIQGKSFENCKMKFIIFICESVPHLSDSSAFKNTTCQFVVPDALYDKWTADTNWSTYADRIVKASEYQPITE
jgi:hypothetical protein